MNPASICKGRAKMDKAKQDSRREKGNGVSASDLAFQIFLDKAKSVKVLGEQGSVKLRSLFESPNLPSVDAIIQILISHDDENARN